MKVYNCWCRKSSPVRKVQESSNAITYECLMCLGTVTIILDPGEVWKERSYGGE